MAWVAGGDAGHYDARPMGGGRVQAAGRRAPRGGRKSVLFSRILLKSKIHGALVTAASVEYEGSITLDRDLVRAANLAPYERVLVASLTTGQRLETYVIEATSGSGAVEMNGAAARVIRAGERVIVMSFAGVPDAGVSDWSPVFVRVDDASNRPRAAGG